MGIWEREHLIFANSIFLFDSASLVSLASDTKLASGDSTTNACAHIHPWDTRGELPNSQFPIP
jgi:hypothetical protein